MWEDYFAQSDSNFVQGVYQQMMQAQPVERCASVTNIHCDANRFWDDFTQSFCPAFFADAVKSNVTAAVLQDAATCTDAQNDDGIQSKLRSLAMMTWLASSINVTSLLSNTTAPPFHVQKDGHLLAGIQDGHSTCTTHSCITGITNAIGNGDQTRTNTQYYYGTYVLYAQDFYAVSGYCANNQTAAAVTGGSAPPGVAAASSGNSSASGFSSSAGQTTNRNTSSVNGGVPAGFTGP
ncbi:MAG: hypothetical protein M1838_001701 [Thelocarpon superellum]|nr:MAG: hypothetical protein M1838_001701 [Thelocarpon superellum]